MQTEDGGAHSAVGLRIAACEVGTDGGELVVRLRASDAGRETAERLKIVCAAHDLLLRRHAEHSPHLCLA